MADTPVPRHLYFADGRMLTWYEYPDGRRGTFRLTVDRDSGMGRIDDDEGERVLAENAESPRPPGEGTVGG